MSQKSRAIVSIGAVLAIVIIIVLIASRFEEVRLVGLSVQWRWVILACLFALSSHAMVGFALLQTLTVLGYPLEGPIVLGIALVSTTANYLISAGGVTGFALKAHLLHKRRVPVAMTVMASAVTSAILYAVLGVILVEGFITLLLQASGAKIAIIESGIGLLALIIITVFLLITFFNQKVLGKLSRRIFRWTNRAAYTFSSKEIPPEEFEVFESQLTQGMARIRSGRRRLTQTVLFTCIDWGLAIASLWCCFRAVGLSLPLGQLSAAFTSGQAATLIPFLPAGLGAAEGSISALMSGFGVSVGQALVAAMLFRLVYYGAPSILSVLVFWGLKVSEPTVLEKAANLDLGYRKQ